ncbi:MAG: STAS domain-containing protein [Luteibaculaceae bacterium]
MLVTSTRTNEILHISMPDGKIDATNHMVIKSELFELIERSPKGVVLDFVSVQYIDSSGIGALLSVYRNCKSHNIPLCLTQINPLVSSIFSISKLDTVFSIKSTLEEAKVFINENS